MTSQEIADRCDEEKWKTTFAFWQGRELKFKFKFKFKLELELELVS